MSCTNEHFEVWTRNSHQHLLKYTSGCLRKARSLNGLSVCVAALAPAVARQKVLHRKRHKGLGMQQSSALDHMYFREACSLVGTSICAARLPPTVAGEHVLHQQMMFELLFLVLAWCMPLRTRTAGLNARMHAQLSSPWVSAWQQSRARAAFTTSLQVWWAC